MEKRIERESDRREVADLLVLSRPAKSLQNWCRLQQKNLSILGLLKRKEWPQCHRESSWQVHQSRPCQKEKEQSRLSRVPDHEGEGSQGEQEPHLDERDEDQCESMKRKGWTPQTLRRRGEGKQEEPP